MILPVKINPINLIWATKMATNTDKIPPTKLRIGPDFDISYITLCYITVYSSTRLDSNTI